MKCRRGSRRYESGQNLIEAAISLVIMMLIGISCFALTVRIVAQVEISSAAANAAASVTAAPLGSGLVAQQYAQDAFVGTLKQHLYIQPGTVTCTSAGYFSGNQATANTLITCNATAKLMLSQFPFPVGPDIDLTATASVTQPIYRQCNQVTSAGAQQC